MCRQIKRLHEPKIGVYLDQGRGRMPKASMKFEEIVSHTKGGLFEEQSKALEFPITILIINALSATRSLIIYF
jgi:hypothetical protein